MRLLLGVAVGLALGLGIVGLGAWVALQAFPPPADVNPTMPSQMHAYYASAGLAALAPLFVTWGLAGLASAFAGTAIARAANAGRATAIVLALLAGLNAAMLPAPMTVWAAPVITLLLGWIASSIRSPKAA